MVIQNQGIHMPSQKESIFRGLFSYFRDALRKIERRTRGKNNCRFPREHLKDGFPVQKLNIRTMDKNLIFLANSVIITVPKPFSLTP
jgi:hypothetical protein